ncbi:MAG: GNAT family N-acetyltransferase [Lachnospiraceae bacterium]|jgi:RimJ/RimL family protein N-acetyltransferase|nr:GNAT family N-acetyltransferase [Lachnospiraceae bacterium]
MKYFKKLVGEKVYLSPMNEEDSDKFVKWLNDFEVTDYTGRTDMIITLSEEKKWFENIGKENLQFAIVTLENDELIGTISLENINNIFRTAILGIFIGEDYARNKGYGTDAIKLMLDFGFNYINLHNIKLTVFEFNERAKACYKACGFVETGRRRKCMYVNGKYYDIILMDILQEEFTESYIKNKAVK